MKEVKQSLWFGWVIGLAILCKAPLFAQEANNVKITQLAIKNVEKQNEIKELTIGDKVPDIVLDNIYNYCTKTTNLSEFKGKLLILDFWATWCGSCIEAFPKMHNLQKKFNDDLQVILVNTYMGDDKDKVQAYFEKRKARTGQAVELPYSLQQSSLSDYFPHKFVPHYVWIDKTGTVIAITSQLEVTTENIKSILEGKNVSLHEKKDIPDFDSQNPLFVNGNGGSGDEFLYRSILTGYKEGLGGVTGLKPEENGKVSRYYIINHPLLLIFQNAYRKVLKYPPNRTIIEVKDPLKFKSSYDDTARYRYTYCYEINTPPVSFDELLKFVQDDLERIFGVKVKNEKRTLDCWVLTATDQVSKSFTKGRASELEMDKSSIKKHIFNNPVSALTNLLNSFMEKPVVDETGLLNNIDIELPADFYNYDIKALKNFLHKNGFNLIEGKRELEVAVITDK